MLQHISEGETPTSRIESIFFMGTGELGTILVVDDEQPVLEYVAKSLRTSGYHVVTAVSGEDALTIVEQQNLNPHVLIADLVLPGMSGFAVADMLRRANPDLKTLFISGYTGAEYFRQMKVSTADIPFLQKPFNVDALLAKVQEILLTERSRHGQRKIQH